MRRSLVEGNAPTPNPSIKCEARGLGLHFVRQYWRLFGPLLSSTKLAFKHLIVFQRGPVIPYYMQRNSNKARKQKDISILDSLDSLSLSPFDHGTNQHPSSTRRTSSSSAGAMASAIHQNSTPSYIKSTPPEVLVHIFSFLDPAGIASASLVCRDWHSVARDEYAWKAAFERFFGVHSFIPRLSTSWIGEYIHRSRLLRYAVSTKPDR